MLTEAQDHEKHGENPDPSPRAAAVTAVAHTHPRGVVTASGLLLLSASALIATGGAVWTWRKETQTSAAVQQAEEERDQARKAEAEAKRQREQALTAQRATAQQRDEALTAKKAAQRAEQVSRAVLAFLQNNVLSAGHAMGWGGEQTKDVKLRQAVDAAVAKVDKSFADQPLAEASIREILGSTYVDLAEPALGAKQLERALALRERVLGPDHPETGDCRNKLAVAYRLADRTAEAGRLYERQSVKASGGKPKAESR